MKDIKISGLDQFQHENQTWSRTLDFYLQENSFLKTRLAQVVDRNINKELVDTAEQFQNDFIHNDECIKDLQKDIYDMQQQIKVVVTGGQFDENKMLKQQNKLRNEMGYFESGFANLKNKFNHYLVSLIYD